MVKVKGEEMEVKKHSGLGIASFITSIASAMLIFLLLVIVGIMETAAPGGIDENSAISVIVGALIILFAALVLVAFGLGISGLVQKDRDKIFAILGTVFSAVTIVGVILIMIMGLSME
jgi:hypothetical protein